MPAGVSTNTITIERGDELPPGILGAIRAALESAGVIFSMMGSLSKVGWA
jgi:hypothetical protein